MKRKRGGKDSEKRGCKDVRRKEFWSQRLSRHGSGENKETKTHKSSEKNRQINNGERSGERGSREGTKVQAKAEECSDGG